MLTASLLNTNSTKRKLLKKYKERTLIIKDSLTLMYEIGISFPNYILQKLGINLLPSIISQNVSLFTVILAGAVIGVSCSVSIGLGVGLGVGLTCAKSDTIYANNSGSPIIGNITGNSSLPFNQIDNNVTYTIAIGITFPSATVSVDSGTLGVNSARKIEKNPVLNGL